jgi:hypothetical protein
MRDNAAKVCPNAAIRHTPMPSGYIAWHVAAERREQAGQRQRRCPTCNLWTIWTGGRGVAGLPRRPDR